MLTFKDLTFEPTDPRGPSHEGVRAGIHFENGYGISVIRTEYAYCDYQTYEVAILDKDGHVCYDTPITNDVLGYQTEEDITRIMEEMQAPDFEKRVLINQLEEAIREAERILKDTKVKVADYKDSKTAK